jgi:phage shock protein PspC (stress-responsive transcriptional regulator)
MKTFKRSKEKKVFGVCSGFANYTKTDPVLWRLLFVVLFCTPFPIVIFYLLTTLITESE